MDYLYAAGNLVLDVPPSTVIGAVLMALVVALATAKVSQWVGRRDAGGNTTVMTTVFMLGNILSMTVVAGYVMDRENELLVSIRRGRNNQVRHGHIPFPGPPNSFHRGGRPPMGPWPKPVGGWEQHSTWQILENADTDGDGKLSPEESARLMEKVKPGHRSADRHESKRKLEHS